MAKDKGVRRTRAYANRRKGMARMSMSARSFTSSGFIALVSFQVLQILYVQLTALGKHFSGKNEATMPYHQYIVVEHRAGVIAYSKPSLMASGSIVSSFARGKFCKRTGEVVNSTDAKSQLAAQRDHVYCIKK